MKSYGKTLLSATGVIALCLSCTEAFAGSDSQYSLGIEGFRDDYKEDAVSLDDYTYYGSVTGSYTHNWNAFFAALDGRVSYGTDHYSSPSGSSSGAPQWEFEMRPRVGYTIQAGAQGSFAPYIGLGARYFRDDGKGQETDLGAEGYDRRIFQLYLPVGATYAYTTQAGWTIAPNLEYDQFLWGQVSTRLGNIGLLNVLNNQDSGWGVRGSLMVGRDENGWSWQVGPFFRYWNIGDSDYSSPGDGSIGLEPDNTRLQVGLALRALW